MTEKPELPEKPESRISWKATALHLMIATPIYIRTIDEKKDPVCVRRQHEPNLERK
jgi:hypothetical protein